MVPRCSSANSTANNDVFQFRALCPAVTYYICSKRFESHDNNPILRTTGAVQKRKALPGLATTESYIPYFGIVIEDLRGKENDFALDQNGFAVFRDHQQHNSAFKSSSVLACLGQNFLESSIKYEEYDDYACPSVCKSQRER
jgi:hypothetical protein